MQHLSNGADEYGELEQGDHGHQSPFGDDGGSYDAGGDAGGGYYGLNASGAVG